MDKVSYSLGLSLGNNLASSGIKDLTVADFVRGLTCVLEDAEPEITYEEAEEVLKTYFTKQQQERFHDNKAAGQTYLEMMPVGSKWRVVIPEEHAYGSHGAGQLIEPYMALIFEIELLGIEGK